MLDTIFYYIGGIGCIIILIVTILYIVHFLYTSLYPMLCKKSEEYAIGSSYFFIIKRKKSIRDEKGYSLFLQKLKALIDEFGG